MFRIVGGVFRVFLGVKQRNLLSYDLQKTPAIFR